MKAIKLGLVLIGRNEGERFLRCLASIGRDWPVVYVDSGSSDGSVAAARAAGVEVVELDMTRPFTAARARNAGLERLCAIATPEFVQFVDGDCEVRAGWLAAGMDFLERHPRAAVVCGRNRERFPEASRYNRLCDGEWNTPVGEAKACGGIAMMRLAALDQSGLFDPALIAGEEPELCVRLRGLGWQIWRIADEMTWHDAAMTRFGQWWKRTRRGGFAAAQGAALHGRGPDRLGMDQMRKAVVWAMILPLVTVLAMAVTPWGAGLLLIWPLQVVRLVRRSRFARETNTSNVARETNAPNVAGKPKGSLLALETWEEPFFLTLGKFPEAMGVAEYHLRRISGRRAGLIEYK